MTNQKGTHCDSQIVASRFSRCTVSRTYQFGEGNFLRAFVDWQIDLLNEHTDLNFGVVVVRPIETSSPSLSTRMVVYYHYPWPE